MTQAAGKRDETTDFEWFMLEFHRMECCELAKAKFLKLIKSQAGKVVRFNHRILSRPYQVERARQLLSAGNDRPTTRDRLVSELGCSTRKAYHLISEAIHGGYLKAALVTVPELVDGRRQKAKTASMGGLC